VLKAVVGTTLLSHPQRTTAVLSLRTVIMTWLEVPFRLPNHMVEN